MLPRFGLGERSRDRIPTRRARLGLRRSGRRFGEPGIKGSAQVSLLVYAQPCAARARSPKK